MANAQRTRWCFTLPNPSGPDRERVDELAEDDRVNYLCVGEETAPTTGLRHYQGYVEFVTKRTRSGAQKILGFSQACHLEPSNGSREQNRRYCSKEGSVLYDGGRGINVTQGTRTDLEEVKHILDSGGSIRDVAETNFSLFCRYHNSLQRYALLVSEPRNYRTQCIWIYGRPGTGKSRWIHESNCGLGPRPTYWMPRPQADWWDGYTGQPFVAIDDFDGSMPRTFLLRILDRYPLKVPYKGGFTEFRARVVFITSQRHPDDYYPLADGNEKAAIRRRIDELYDTSRIDWQDNPIIIQK